MRAVLSISIPPKKLAALKKRAKSEGMTISAYVIRQIDEESEHVISEQELLSFWQEAKADLQSGKVKKLHNPDDLLLPELP